MKNTVKIYGSLVILVLLTIFAGHANTHGNPITIANNADTLPAILGDNLVGGWSYTVEGAPAGYQKALLIIVKDGDTYKVQVQVGGGALLAENVKVKGNTIDFEVMIEGGRVEVSLTATGNKISGKSTSPEGSYKINGEKTLSMD